jgi:DNA-binding NtrC family response regulator
MPVRSLSPEADDLLRVHDWPGNFRELLGVLRDASRRATGERIGLGDLPLYLRSQPSEPLPKLPLDPLLETVERRLIELALREAHGNKSKAAEFLSIWRARLLRRMEQFGISDTEPPGEGTAHA